MFDIGFLELLVIGVMALLILGPERLPGAVRTVSLWMSRIRRSFQQVKLEIEREVDIAELKQQLHNETVMEKLEQTRDDVEQSVDQARETLKRELGQDHYDLSDAFPSSQDTLPEHDPLPDPDEEPEQRSPSDADRS